MRRLPASLLLLSACLDGTGPSQAAPVVHDGSVLRIATWNRSRYNCDPRLDMVAARDTVLCQGLDSILTVQLDSVMLRLEVHGDSTDGPLEFFRGTLTGTVRSCASVPEVQCRDTPISQFVPIQRYPDCRADGPDAIPECRYQVLFSVSVSYREVNGSYRGVARQFQVVEQDGRLTEVYPPGSVETVLGGPPRGRSWSETGWELEPDS